MGRYIPAALTREDDGSQQQVSASAVLVAERVEQAVRTSPVCADADGDPAEMAISVSIGVAALDGLAAGSIEDLIRRADEALYFAKQAGRQCVRGYQASLG